MAFRTFPLRTNAERTYIRLTEVFDWLEPEIIGGKNNKLLAKQRATVFYGNQDPIEDDVVGDKKIFRKRSAYVVTKFLDDHDLVVGSAIKMERLAPYTYRFTPG
ncbi:hypothetical protein [Pseudomonas sp. NY15354]|uniref:hypothetical protein n=1 Tax=Pseudomonas sp. NY15354 TaxID=3400351 RepID=UPI003A852975